MSCDCSQKVTMTVSLLGIVAVSAAVAVLAAVAAAGAQRVEEWKTSEWLIRCLILTTNQHQ